MLIIFVIGIGKRSFLFLFIYLIQYLSRGILACLVLNTAISKFLAIVGYRKHLMVENLAALTQEFASVCLRSIPAANVKVLEPISELVSSLYGGQ